MLGAAALVACGDDDGGDGTGATGGRGGSAGGAGRAGSGGLGGAGGTAVGGNGGSSMAGAAGAPGGTACVGAAEGGCARITVPVDAATDNGDFEIDLGVAGVDLSATTVTFRVKSLAATGGAVQVYVKNGAPQSYQGYYTGYRTLATTTAFTDIVVNLSACSLPGGGADAGAGDAGDAGGGGGATLCGPATGNVFDTRAIRFVGLQLLAPAAAPFADASIDVDSIKFSVNPPANFLFTAGVEGLAGNVGAPPPAGFTVTFATAP